MVSGNDDRRIDEIINKLDKIDSVLRGDEYNEIGLVGRIDDHESRLKVLEKFKDKSMIIIGSLLIPSAFGLIQIFNVLKSLV